MITKLILRNFKRFEEVEIELGNPVVFIGPNNSGKTTALQALALWELGVKKWNEKRRGKKTTPEKRPGVTMNRRDLVSLPVPDANLLWRDLHVRDVQRTDGKQETRNIRIDIVVEGVTADKSWVCGLEFDYANEESFYCRPLRLSEIKNPDRMVVPDAANAVQIAFLPPMSGLAANEVRLDPGAINVKVGEGRTAEVLRNLCHKILTADEKRSEGQRLWPRVVDQIQSLFGSHLDEPKYIGERGEIVMTYTEEGIHLDLSCTGRGLQQTLLLLAYMYANPGAVLLLDEPDAHLEILRQRQVYQLLTDVARVNANQIIAASHSEVLLNEAADRDVVVAFVGKPHRIDDRGSQVLKSLKEIGFEHYYQAELVGWVLYLEGSTDLSILRAFAQTLEYHEAMKALARPFVHYVGNVPSDVSRHFWGVREALPQVLGVALFDKLTQALPDNLGAKGLMWNRREIENYICSQETLLGYARATAEEENAAYPLFAEAERENRIQAMRDSISEIAAALKKLGKGSPWDPTTKVSDEFLGPVFEEYFRKLKLPNIMSKKDFDVLAGYLPREKADPEIKEKLDAIVDVVKEVEAQKKRGR